MGVLCLATLVTVAQRAPRTPRIERDEAPAWVAERDPKTAREVENGIGGNTPTWPVDEEFKNDQSTFTRIHYDTSEKYGFGSTSTNRWAVDLPRSDLNFSWRLQQVTAIKVSPDGRIIRLTDKELFDYPFIYIVEPGRLVFTEEEVSVLRRYLLNGGFLMCDDFWGDRQWSNFTNELHRVFPNRPIVDLPLDHPIFRCVFQLKEKPQVPGFDWGTESQYTGITYEARHNPGAEEPHYRAVLDDKGRIMVMLCHNTDLGDGWEREGEGEYYFRTFSEKKAYPIGINIVFYTMAH
jgi:hypothetical protein